MTKIHNNILLNKSNIQLGLQIGIGSQILWRTPQANSDTSISLIKRENNWQQWSCLNVLFKLEYIHYQMCVEKLNLINWDAFNHCRQRCLYSFTLTGI